jgi:hypothetical protein
MESCVELLDNDTMGKLISLHIQKVKEYGGESERSSKDI